NERRAKQRELELHDKIFEQPGIDELRIFRPRDPDVRPGQYIVDLAREEKAGNRRECERGQRLDEPRAQLDQMIHQGRLGGFDLLFFRFASHCGLPEPPEDVNSAGASGTSGPTPAPATSLSRSSAAA